MSDQQASLDGVFFQAVLRNRYAFVAVGERRKEIRQDEKER